jgi:hypothetical protein
MNPRSVLHALLGLTLPLLACGVPSSPSGPGLGLELLIDRAVADDLGAFQVVVLPHGQSRRCADLQSTCLNKMVKSTEPLLLQGADGRQVHALHFTAGLAGGAQQLQAQVPVGRDYVVIIEALSKASPPHFLGSSCNYLDAVSATHNEPLIAAPITLKDDVCDPTFPP